MNRSNLPAMFNELFDELTPFRSVFSPFRETNACQVGNAGGVSIYENDEAIVVEAAVPGVRPEDIQVTFDKRGVSIEGKGLEEKSDVKYHLKSSASYSYWIPLPSGRIDEQARPDAVCKDGIIKISFAKSRSSKPLKISVKQG